MFVTATMKHIAGSVLLSNADKVAKIFLKYGVIEPIPVKTLEEGANDGVRELPCAATHENIAELRRHIEVLLYLANVPLPQMDEDALEDMQPANIAQCNAFVKQIDNIIVTLREQQQALEEKIHQKKELLQAIQKTGGQTSEALAKLKQNAENSSTLRARAGKVPKSFFLTLYQTLNNSFSTSITYTQEDQYVFMELVYFADDEARINTVLQQGKWIEVPLEDIVTPASEHCISELQAQLAQLVAEQKEINKEIGKRISAHKKELINNWVTLHLNELYLSVKQSFAQTEYMCFFSGWIPERSVKTVVTALKDATAGQITYEIRDAAEVKDASGHVIAPPTETHNPKLLRPFESLIRTYSVPAYNTLDSTLPVAILFVIMFGLMFADAGHGLVVILLGALTCFLGKKKGQDMGALMMYCGCASIVTGILFGSYFGYQLTKPLWFDMESVSNSVPSKYHLQTSIVSINDIFRLAIVFGMGVIYLSYFFNWINRLCRKEWVELFLERNGILGGWMYGVGIVLVWNYVASNYTSFGDTGHIGYTLGLPMCLLVLAEPVKFFSQKKDIRPQFTPGLIGAWIGHWMIEVFEFIVNSLSNTISFIRVAGLGMAHVILMSTFCEMAQGLPLWGYLAVVLLANTLVITLEGLSAGINSVRLNYYEFFSRYFIGGGRLYQPIKLNN